MGHSQQSSIGRKQPREAPIASVAMPDSLPATRHTALATASLFVLAATGLSFEIVVTRLFSLLFHYHYAFLAVALGVLGLSLGAAFTAWLLHRSMEHTQAPPLADLLLRLGIALPLAPVLMLHRLGNGSILLPALIALVPFVLIGMATARIFAQDGAHSSRLYAADLAGAAGGVLLTLGLLTVWSPFTIAQIMGILVLLTCMGITTLQPNTPRYRWALPVAGLLLATTVGLWYDPNHFSVAQLANAPRDKTMFAILRDPAQAARLTRTLWSPFARVDVVETNDPTAKFIFTDGGAGSYMMRFDGDLDAVSDLRNTPEYLPFTTHAKPTTLILGAGAGKDIVLALLAGAPEITAVEVNPAVVAATRADAAYNGDILDHPTVRLAVGDARTFVERSQEVYDLIYLNLVYTQAAEPTSLALVENYIFTTQAFQRYFEHLAPSGHLALITHNALEGSRAMVTALQALANVGIAPAQALDHLALWMRSDKDPTLRTSILLLSKTPLTPETLQTTAAQGQALGLQPLFVPGQFETAFAPLRQGMGLAAFVQEDAAYDLSATDDNRPFFFNLDWGLPPAIRQGLLITAVAALGLLGLALRQRTAKEEWPWLAALLYAALIGIGFMWIEAPLIQRLQLLLGYPVLSLATVLAALLAAGGLGSLLSGWWASEGRSPLVMWSALWVSGTALLYWLFLPQLLNVLLPLPLAVRILAAVVLAALPGLGLGMPFPMLLRRFQASPQKVALLWSVNGVCSVLGSLLAVAVAMSYGFGVTLLGGAILYAMVALLVWRLKMAWP